MTPEERDVRSNAFRKALSKLMRKHEISTIRGFDDTFCGFHKDGAGIFICSRIDALAGRDSVEHNKLNTDWETYSTERAMKDDHMDSLNGCL